ARPECDTAANNNLWLRWHPENTALDSEHVFAYAILRNIVYRNMVYRLQVLRSEDHERENHPRPDPVGIHHPGFAQRRAAIWLQHHRDAGARNLPLEGQPRLYLSGAQTPGKARDHLQHSGDRQRNALSQNI